MASYSRTVYLHRLVPAAGSEPWSLDGPKVDRKGSIREFPRVRRSISARLSLHSTFSSQSLPANIFNGFRPLCRPPPPSSNFSMGQKLTRR